VYRSAPQYFYVGVLTPEKQGKLIQFVLDRIHVAFRRQL
jgi:hypothetical protein